MLGSDYEFRAQRSRLRTGFSRIKLAYNNKRLERKGVCPDRPGAEMTSSKQSSTDLATMSGTIMLLCWVINMSIYRIFPVEVGHGAMWGTVKKPEGNKGEEEEQVR